VRREPVARTRRRCAALLVAALASAGCRQRVAPAAPAAASAEDWLTDAHGRRYQLRPLPKTHAVRLDDGTVRTAVQVPLEVVREDDRFYYYKLYAAPTADAAAPAVPPPSAPAPVTPEHTGRLGLRAFDAGLPMAGQWRDGFAVADVNGDGVRDLVHGPARKGVRRPHVFLGDGHGGWRRWDTVRFPPLPYDYGDARVADFNADGHADIALAVHLRGVLALVGDGRGGFAEAGRGLDFARDATTPAFSSRALGAADLDGDARPDLVALGDGPRLARARGQSAATATGAVVYVNGGDGSWRPRARRVGSGLFGSSLAFGDFDADGRPDLALASGVLGRTDFVYLNRGAQGWESVVLPGFARRAYVRAVAAADFDADGRDDVAVAYSAFTGETWRSGIDVLRAGGWTAQPILDEAGPAGPNALAAGDVDGDGRPDLVALTASGETWVLRADGGGRFTRDAVSPAYGGGCRGTHVEVADLDGDGTAEIVAAFAREPEPDDGAAACPSGGGLAAWKVVPGRG
jgi:hypothetical protein